MDQYDAVDWLCAVWGAVGARQSELGSREAVSDWEKLIDIFGHTEYCVSNAGDFENMRDVYPEFRTCAASIAKPLGLIKTAALFEKPESDLIEEFEQMFIPVCLEIKNFVETLPDAGAVGKVSSDWKPL